MSSLNPQKRRDDVADHSESRAGCELCTPASSPSRFGVVESFPLVGFSLSAIYASTTTEGIIQITLLLLAWLLVVPLVILFSGFSFPKRAAILALYGAALIAFGSVEFKTAHVETNSTINQNSLSQQIAPATGKQNNNGTINNNFVQIQKFDASDPVTVTDRAQCPAGYFVFLDDEASDNGKAGFSFPAGSKVCLVQDQANHNGGPGFEVRPLGQ